jgi:hypothetical protein
MRAAPAVSTPPFFGRWSALRWLDERDHLASLIDNANTR